MLCLSTTLLLAATCLLVSAGGPTKTTTTCEGNNVHHLSCAEDFGVISVQKALYGRVDSVTCTEGKPVEELSTQCSLPVTVDMMKSSCDGKKVCEINTNDFKRFDFCRLTYKYLQTEYICLPATYLVTCENSVAHLQCDEGQIISVFSANYGRHDKTTCSRGREQQVQYRYCSRPTTKVAESCNGKNSCTIMASSSVLGDPCDGTYKYLEVAYKCLYPDPQLK